MSDRSGSGNRGPSWRRERHRESRRDYYDYDDYEEHRKYDYLPRRNSDYNSVPRHSHLPSDMEKSPSNAFKSFKKYLDKIIFKELKESELTIADKPLRLLEKHIYNDILDAFTQICQYSRHRQDVNIDKSKTLVSYNPKVPLYQLQFEHNMKASVYPNLFEWSDLIQMHNIHSVQKLLEVQLDRDQLTQIKIDSIQNVLQHFSSIPAGYIVNHSDINMLNKELEKAKRTKSESQTSSSTTSARSSQLSNQRQLKNSDRSQTICITPQDIFTFLQLSPRFKFLYQQMMYNYQVNQ
ncbi:hypothetical protein TVAG_222830 [Trichomonas vaginalis G3]|uniref:Uncharacterized protein n=1 Tax=Trichomonas vaginalis (strain ATCC PRA-98 / G3) TaxID=412133 RepID=A2FHX7_TRIV3|nr:hypothetical protein TVAGG3_0347720 [Trichomonas vaginalis G3]EAX95486.1 hypothetical protein TVAG_222830 [Trichomonas vaginalis G3]KAI5531081.1 hypothetical protein TVAGG3_0347720 [Trichomonas vaginalis G3]|eukprot:XP_001308416.1 hypothetical protein [Trichomonas vaginalis G3]